MSAEDINRKLLSKLIDPRQPTPYQIQRQIELNRRNQEKLSKLQQELGIPDVPTCLVDMVDKGPEFLANLKASIENLIRQPDGYFLISSIEPGDIRPDGTIRIKRLKRKI
jgi:hypothetical protein